MVKTMNDKQIRIGYKIGGSFLKIIAIMEALVLKFYFLIYILLMKRLKRIIIVYQLKWKNKIMEKLLLFFVKINPS